MHQRIAIVDDSPFLVSALEDKLAHFDDIKIDHKAYDGTELLDLLQTDSNLDIILMDVEMPQLDGVKTTQIVKSKYPHIKILILTAFDDDETIFAAIKAGADGYLLKDANFEELGEALTQVTQGGAPMTPSIATRTLRLLRNPISVEKLPNEEPISLTRRETDILEQLATGLTYTQIATNLIISPSTVRKHLENIYKKLQVHNKMEAVQKARDHHVI